MNSLKTASEFLELVNFAVSERAYTHLLGHRGAALGAPGGQGVDGALWAALPQLRAPLSLRGHYGL